MIALLSFSLGEALSALRRGWRSSLLALLTVAAAVFVAASALLVSGNAREILTRLGAASELTVFLKPDATAADRDRIGRLIQQSPVVAASRLVSPDEALKRFTADVPDLAPLTAALGENPFPAAFEVRLHDELSGSGARPSAAASAAADEQTHALVSALAQAGGVEDVRYDRQVIDRLLGGLRIIERLGAMLGAVLVLAAVLTIASVLRLSYETRRDEIGILYLVGAPPRAIRGPFVAEGLLLASLGALLAFALLALVFAGFRGTYGPFITQAFGLPALWFLPWSALAGLLFASAGVGAAAGLGASWRRR